MREPLHLIWLGDGFRQDVVDRAAAMNPDREVMVHRDDSELHPTWRATYDAYAKSPQLKSDLLRLSVLRKYGGFYHDCDVTLLAPATVIADGWSTLTIPTYCHSVFMPGDVLYCPKTWQYWWAVDGYVERYASDMPLYSAFMNQLFLQLPEGSCQPVVDCDLYPSNSHMATGRALMWRGFSLGEAAASSPAPPHGPGAELKTLLAGWPLRITSAPNCPCNAYARKMDEWGPDACERRLPEILDWLESQAKARKLAFVRLAAEQVVRLAIRRARKSALRLDRQGHKPIKESPHG
jgi:hypothetical protein